MTELPNPGSKEAIRQGCSCPVMDNNHGAGAYNSHGTVMFWYNLTCKIHGYVRKKDMPDGRQRRLQARNR